MSGFSPFTTSAPDVGSNKATGGNPLILGLLSALANLPAQNAARKKEGIEEDRYKAETAAYKAQLDPKSPENVERQLRTTQLQQQIDTTQQNAGQQQFQTLYQQMQTNPSLQTSPAYKAALDKAAKAAGLPENPAFNADGSFNPNIGMKPISTLPVNAQSDAFRNELMAKQPGSERENYARSFGIYIPKDDPILTAKPTFTTKASNDIAKTAQLGVHYANADATATARATALSVLNKARADEAEGKLSLDRVQADNYVRIQNAKINDANINAQAHATEAQAAMSRAQNGARAMGGGNQRLAQRFYAEGMSAVERGERAAAGMDAAVADAQAAGADDSVLQPLLQKKAQADAQLKTAKDQLSTLNTEFGANTGHAQGIQGASGARKVTVTNIGGSKFENGKTYTDAGGRRATYNNGTWTPVP